MANSRSPWKTWMSTDGWLSAAVEKTWLFDVGMVVLRSTRTVHHLAQGLDAEAQGGHVQQQHVGHVAARTPPWIAAPTPRPRRG